MHKRGVVWLSEGNPNAHRGGKNSVLRYNEYCIARRQKYPYNESKYSEAIENVNKNGFHIFRGVVPHETIKKLSDEFELQVRLGKNLKEHNEHFTVIDQPFLNCPTTVEMAFDDMIIDVASEYFKCTPAFGTLNFRKSYATEKGAIKHQLFHVDPNSVKFLKFFVYLNDVEEDGGPLTIVEGSGNKKFAGWDAKYRWSKAEMQDIYGKDSVRYLTAKVGDLIVATTTCFHRGTKPEKADRTMLTLNYVMHPEEFKPPSYKIKKEDIEKLSNIKKPLVDYLIVE
tara:strand:- start:9355 stop:10203 length:849 start_codon:yes stop_codon:yes gene_type:complete